MTYPAIISLRKTCGPRHLLYYFMWHSDKKVWRPWTSISLPVHSFWTWARHLIFVIMNFLPYALPL